MYVPLRKKIQKGDHCLNCERSLEGENFCPDCGQLNNTAKPTFGELLLEALANLFAFDSKFYKSIWPLMRHPGTLSLEIVKGRKNTYLPPIRLFLLVLITTLALISLQNRLERGFGDVSYLRQGQEESDRLVRLNRSEIDSLVAQEEEHENLPALIDSVSNVKPARMYQHAADYPDQSLETALAALGYPDSLWNKFLYHSMLKLTLMSITEFFSFIKSNLVIILLLFVPIMGLVLKLLYLYKQEYFYVDHFTFSIHTQTAFFVLIGISTLLVMLFSTRGFYWILLFFPFYLFVAMRRFYQQSRLLTTVNYLVVNTVFAFVAVIFMVFVGMVSFLLF